MGRLIYGGSFNPVHIAHLRLAIEAFEMLGPLVSGVDFVPAASPPHKDGRNLLPFALRAELVRLALVELPGMICNDVEGHRAGPSYTWDTLSCFRKKYPEQDLYFLLGSEDYRQLPEWHNGLELVKLSNLVVATRGDFKSGDFFDLTRSLWPDAVPDASGLDSLRYAGSGCACMKLSDRRKIYFLSIPWIELSSTRFRELWLQGRNVDYLAPAAVLAKLAENSIIVRECWQENI